MHTIGPDIDPEDAIRLGRVYDAVSTNIERENALINFRIVWAIFLSAGITATETFVVSFVRDHYPSQTDVQIAAQIIVITLSVLAALFCYISTRGVRAAQAQMEDVKEAYHKRASQFNDLGFPRPFGDKVAHRTGDYNAIVYPVVLLVLWLVLAAIQGHRFLSISIVKPEVQYEISKDADLKKALNDISQSIRNLGPALDALKPAAVTKKP